MKTKNKRAAYSATLIKPASSLLPFSEYKVCFEKKKREVPIRPAQCLKRRFHGREYLFLQRSISAILRRWPHYHRREMYDVYLDSRTCLQLRASRIFLVISTSQLHRRRRSRSSERRIIIRTLDSNENQMTRKRVRVNSTKTRFQLVSVQKIFLKTPQYSVCSVSLRKGSRFKVLTLPLSMKR